MLYLVPNMKVKDYLHPLITRTKNSIMQRRRMHSVVFPLLLLLSGMLFGQTYNEVTILVNDQFSIQKTITAPGSAVLVHPDAAIGQVTTSENSGIYTVLFTPVDGVTGTTTFTFQYVTGTPQPLPKVESYRITIVESWVKANMDYFSVDFNSADNVLNVLANDTVSSNGTISVSRISAVQHGSAEIDAQSGNISFTPADNYSGSAYIAYTVCNDQGACDETQVSIQVREDGSPDETGTIYLSTRSGKSIDFFLPESGFSVELEPGHGSASSLSGAAWRYSPDAGFSGTDTFSLNKDNQILRDVVVRVYFKAPANTFALDDIIHTHINKDVSFNVLDNDLVPNYQLTSYSLPDSGTLTVTDLAEGQFNYQPPADFNGAVEFEYTSCWQTRCETAKARIYVGDMIPRNHISYQLRTIVNTPLVINYEIPLDGYYFDIQANPISGTLDYYPGAQSIQVGCEEISGKNLLVYQPNDGFTGDDDFEINYCVDPDGDGENVTCHLVKAFVEVVDFGLNMNCLCVDGCVWPGDANSDGVVDMSDLLTLGWQFGQFGEERAYPDNSLWFAQSANDWNASQPITGMNAKYIDANGDGFIDLDDISAIEEHYLLQHTLVPQEANVKADYNFELIPVTTSVDSGDLAVIHIAIGTENNPVLDMHGMKFSLNLPLDLVDENTIDVQFHDNSWLGYNSPSKALQMYPAPGRVDAGITRLNGLPASGQGVIGTLSFIVDEDIAGIKPKSGKIPLRISLSGGNILDSQGWSYDLNNSQASIDLILNADPANVQPLDQAFFLFPNPATSEINLHLNGDRSMQSAELYDMSGRLVTQWKNLQERHDTIGLPNVQPGIYMIRVITNEGVVSKKLEILPTN